MNGKEAFFAEIMEKWRSQVLNTIRATVMISACTPESRPRIKESLKKIQGVKELVEKSFQNGVCEISLEVDGALIKNLDEKIIESCPGLLLTSKTSHRLDFEMQSALPVTGEKT